MAWLNSRPEKQQPKKKWTKYAKWYQLPEWKQGRLEFLEQNPYCVVCGELAKVVDHIKRIASAKTVQEAWQLFINRSNWQSMCVGCHNRKSAKERTNAN